jgi:hypothetical protein
MEMERIVSYLNVLQKVDFHFCESDSDNGIDCRLTSEWGSVQAALVVKDR